MQGVVCQGVSEDERNQERKGVVSFFSFVSAAIVSRGDTVWPAVT